jgi:hypothetical protein
MADDDHQNVLKAWGIKEMWMDENLRLNALWIMFHNLMDFMPSPPQVATIWTRLGAKFDTYLSWAWHKVHYTMSLKNHDWFEMLNSFFAPL